jgi:hypothetical protein
MANKQASQSQQKEPQTGANAWAQLSVDHLDRINGLWGEIAEMEGKLYDGARQAFEQADSMTREYAQYMTDLSSQWRRMFLESTRRAADLFSAQG